MIFIERNNLGIAKDTIACAEKILQQDAIDDRFYADRINNLGFFAGNGTLVSGDDSIYKGQEIYEKIEMLEKDKILSKDKDIIHKKTETLFKLFGDNQS